MSVLYSVPISREDCFLSEMDGEFLLYSKQTMATIYLNSSAATIWQLCDGRRTVATIIDLLKATYPGAAHQVEVDVCATIQKLVDGGMVTLD